MGGWSAAKSIIRGAAQGAAQGAAAGGGRHSVLSRLAAASQAGGEKAAGSGLPPPPSGGGTPMPPDAIRATPDKKYGGMTYTFRDGSALNVNNGRAKSTGGMAYAAMQAWAAGSRSAGNPGADRLQKLKVKVRA